MIEHTLDVRSAEFAAAPGAAPRLPGELARAVIGALAGPPILTIAPQIWSEAAVEPAIREVLSGLFTRMMVMLRAELTAWAASHPEHVGGDPAVWAASITPVLYSVVPGYILQRIMITDFDDRAYLETLTTAFAH